MLFTDPNNLQLTSTNIKKMLTRLAGVYVIAQGFVKTKKIVHSEIRV